MKLDIRSLLAGDRLMKIDYEIPLDTTVSGDPAGLIDGVGFPSPMKVTGDITNTAGYMRMRLSLSAEYETACARCLKPVRGEFKLDLEKTVAPKSELGDLDEYRLDDYAIVEDGFIDLDENLREQLAAEFPMRVLCSEDCKGLCPKCGKNLNDGPCGCPEKERDPRLAPLEKLLAKMRAEEEEKATTDAKSEKQ